MAKKSMINKQQRDPSSPPGLTPLPHLRPSPSVLRKYGICRICFRELAYKGQIPGVRKASSVI